MADVSDGLPGFAAIAPLAHGQVARPRRELMATLSRIDGWGQRAWRELMGAWQLASGVVVLSTLENGVDGDDDPHLVNAILVLSAQGLGGSPRERTATCDWVLREAWRALLAAPRVTCTSYRPGAVVRENNACWIADGLVHLRLHVRLPFAGMCCDGRRFARFVRQLEAFAAPLLGRARRPGLSRLRRCVRIQQRLRQALPEHGLVAFLADGARIARTASDAAAEDCRPLRASGGVRATIDLGSDGRYHGMGITRGVTTIVGAPYHGKSTLLSALAAGRDDHIPDDGRELVVADASALVVQSEEGRRIKQQDLSAFFARLPGAHSHDFSTQRASGATSMAASVLQGCAAGSRLLLIDEDAAAANFLAIDPTMRRLLGRSLDGTVGLLESLRDFAADGVSTVLVVGSSAAALQAAQRVLLMEAFVPRDVSTRVRRLLGRDARSRGPAGASRGRHPATSATRYLTDDPDCLLGPRHFLTVDAHEAERPRLPALVQEGALDLRRSGWILDGELTRGAVVAAAWCCRLARPGMELQELARRYQAFIAARGAVGLDPFHTQLLAVPPWQLVVSVLERLCRPQLASRMRPRH